MINLLATPVASLGRASTDPGNEAIEDRLEAYTRHMTRQQADLIAVDPDIVGGQAHIRGTRIPVSMILDCLAAGLSEDDIIEQYPSLTREGIRAAAAYGAALAREEIFPLPA
jgi:uncharacterized protein (DUF433 family)